MGHTNPNCHEICNACFETLSPIEVVSVGRIITAGKGPEATCDLCNQKYPWAQGHHVDMVHVKMALLYMERAMTKALEGFVWEKPTEELKQKVTERVRETLKKLHDIMFDKFTKEGEYIAEMPPYGLVRLSNMQVTQGEEEGEVKITMDVKPL